MERGGKGGGGVSTWRGKLMCGGRGWELFICFDWLVCIAALAFSSSPRLVFLFPLAVPSTPDALS